MTLTRPALPAQLDATQFAELGARTLAPLPLSWAEHAPRAEITAPSDFDLNPDARAEWTAGGAPRPAAVLVPVVASAPLSILFTVRTPDLRAHAGQISFPGGKADVSDMHPLATALREAHEEIGLAPHFVRAIGCLDRYRTGTGFEITPVLALIDPVFVPMPDPREVASVFQVPLAFLMDPANHRRETRTINGRERSFHAMPFPDHYIWGATAGILKSMHARMFQ
jgi:8-oxo-dGTP pyrophosphatase MutT (NUDIX family)